MGEVAQDLAETAEGGAQVGKIGYLAKSSPTLDHLPKSVVYL
jgi:hypothetical protein